MSTSPPSQARGRVISMGLAAAIAVSCIAMQIVAYTGCATTKSTVKTMTGAFSSCMRADLGQVVSGASLLSDVAAIIVANPAALEVDLTTLVTTVGLDGVLCAIAAVEAVLAPSGKATTAEAPTGLLRARAWRATKVRS